MASCRNLRSGQPWRTTSSWSRKVPMESFDISVRNVSDSYQTTAFPERCCHESGRDHLVQSEDPNEIPEVVGYNFHNRHKDQEFRHPSTSRSASRSTGSLVSLVMRGRCTRRAVASTSDSFPILSLVCSKPRSVCYRVNSFFRSRNTQVDNEEIA